MEQTRKNTDTAFTISGRLLASCAVAYMVLPTILFLLGWVRPLFSVPAPWPWRRLPSCCA